MPQSEPGPNPRAQAHERLAELVPAPPVRTDAPERVDGTVLDELGISGRTQKPPKLHVLRELELEHAVHYADVDVEPVRALQLPEPGRLPEHLACARDRADTLGELRSVLEEFVCLKHCAWGSVAAAKSEARRTMLCGGVSAALKGHGMRREVGEPGSS
jgi:hypothetical protein